ncbi:hypothetical protein KJ590_03090 [Patescibacteria group bacterium]|nr:hypothetical protein [Patescibacteria group bacterium]
MDEKVKEAVLGNLERLVARIKELEEEVAKLRNNSNQCFWDGRECRRYSEIHGLQECSITCNSCPRLDIDDLSAALDRIFPDSNLSPSCSEETLKEAEIENRRAGEEDAWQEIEKETVAKLADAGIEPAD